MPAAYVVALAQSMRIPKERLYGTLNLARATVDRKIQKRQRLSQDESERILAVAQLIGQVDTIVQESGNPSGFDAAQWMAGWLEHPHPEIPSVVLPEEANLLINPRHRDAKRLRAQKLRRWTYDPRFARTPLSAH